MNRIFHKDTAARRVDEEVNGSSGNRYSGGQIARNTIYNLLGRVLPMAIAVLTIPFIISGLGVERFGILSLAWMVIGYFGIFDIGIGRATTKFVAEAIHNNDQQNLPVMAWTSLGMLILLGFVGGAVLAGVSSWLVTSVFNIPEALREESRLTFLALACSMPFVLGTSGARGVLEGYQRFKLVNAIKIPASSFTFLATAGVLLFSNNLFHLVLTLVCGRVIVFLIHLYACMMTLPKRTETTIISRGLAVRLLKFGGWLTVTTVAGALMSFGYIDRFVISSVLDMEAVAYYSTPFEMTIKVLILSGGLLGVLFPVFSAYARDEHTKLMQLYQRGIKVLLVTMLPVALLIIALAHPILDLWLGSAFAQESALLLQLFAVGVLAIAIASVPSGAVQAIGRPDLTAWRHLAELPVYFGAAWFCANEWGVVGVAAVWACYTIVDVILMFWIARSVLPTSYGMSRNRVAIMGLTGVAGLVLAFMLAEVPDIVVRYVLTTIVLIILAPVSWRWILDESDRTSLKNILRSYLKKDHKPDESEPCA